MRIPNNSEFIYLSFGAGSFCGAFFFRNIETMYLFFSSNSKLIIAPY